MTFERAWVLLFLIAPPLWAWWEWRRTERRLALVLKALSLACIIAALAEPKLSVPETKIAAAVLVDTSVSVSPADLQKASEYANRVDRAKGRNFATVVPFARTARSIGVDEFQKGWRLQPATGEAGRGTDLEAAVKDSLSALPASMGHRLVLLSDGHENRGSVARAAWLARQLGVPIDTVPFTGRPRPNLRIESVSLPTVAFTGERFPIDLVVSAPRRATGQVELSAEGRKLGASAVQLEPGNMQVRLHTSINVAGAVDLQGVLTTPDLGEVRFEQTVTLRRPRILYVSQDPPGTGRHLLDTLKAAQFEIDEVQEAVTGSLSDYQIAVLNNIDFERIPLNRKADLENYVRNGGGLLIIGGERNLYQEGKKVEDALDRALPAKLAPPRSPEGTLVILIVDKSSSMEGRKMELARLAAIGVIENLRPIDSVGVLIFDNSFQWAVPIRKAEDRTLIKRLVAGITPDGGTQIAPALSEGFRRTLPVTATYKHIVLLTDGISEEGDSLSLARDAAAQSVTISTVGLGQDVNRAYLEKIAAFAKGKSYFLIDPSGLEQILLKDVMEHTGSTAVERSIQPEVARLTELLNGVEMEKAPPLKGYVKFISKPSADTLLTVDNKKDPLLALWQFGLGRSGVFASDAKSRWAQGWIGWPGYDRFWVNVFRDLLPHAQSGETIAEYDPASGNLVVDYRLARHVPAPAKIPEIFVIGPGNFRKPMPVKKVAEGAYRGTLPIGNLQGLFRIRPLEESRVFPETGLYRPEEELTQYGSNEALLKQVAEFTGGRFNPAPEQLFQAGGQTVMVNQQWWPGLLAAAVAFSLAELILRKWAGIRDTFRR